MLRRVFALSSLLLAAFALPVDAGPPTKAFISGPKNDATPYVGLLGAVVRPGVYPLSQPQTPLSEVLRMAGGPAGDATGNVRLVRGGKAGQQVFLSPNSGFLVLPGDVLVLDGPQPSRRTHIHRAAHVTGTPHGTEIWRRDPKPAVPEASGVVPIALVNVLDRPVVMKVRGEHATVEKLVELLGQKPDVAETVKILPTVTQVPGDPPLTSQSTLPSGTVLVFTRSRIDGERVPPLPPAKSVEATSLSTSEAAPTRFASPSDAEAIRRMSPAAITLPGPDAREIGPTLGASSSTPLSAPSMSNAFAAGPAETPERTANKLSGRDTPPSASSLKTEMLPPSPGAPPQVEAQSDLGGVAFLKEPEESGPSMRPVPQNPEREVIGYSEPIDAGDRMNAQRNPAPFHTADTSPGFGQNPESLSPRELAALRAQQAFASGLDKPTSAATGPAGALVAYDSAVDDEASDSNASTAAVWGLFGAAALYAGWRAAKKRRAAITKADVPAEAASEPAIPPESVHRPVATVAVAAAEPRVSAASRLATRLDRLIANQMAIDMEPVKMASPMMLYGRPRSAPAGRVDRPHHVAERRPHALAESTTIERATETEMRAAAAVPSGHRVDEAHGESRMASGIAARPHIAERKIDILERALASAGDAPARTVGGTPLSMGAEIGAATAEGATPQ